MHRRSMHGGVWSLHHACQRGASNTHFNHGAKLLSCSNDWGTHSTVPFATLPQHGLLPIHLQVLHYLMRANRYNDLPIAIAGISASPAGRCRRRFMYWNARGLLTKEPDAHIMAAHVRAVCIERWLGRAR